MPFLRIDSYHEGYLKSGILFIFGLCAFVGGFMWSASSQDKTGIIIGGAVSCLAILLSVVIFGLSVYTHRNEISAYGGHKDNEESDENE